MNGEEEPFIRDTNNKLQLFIILFLEMIIVLYYKYFLMLGIPWNCKLVFLLTFIDLEKHCCKRCYYPTVATYIMFITIIIQVQQKNVIFVQLGPSLSSWSEARFDLEISSKAPLYVIYDVQSADLEWSFNINVESIEWTVLQNLRVNLAMGHN